MRQEVKNKKYAVGIGYVAIPFGSDRNKYVETCFRRERIAIQLDAGGSVIQNCYVDKSVLKEISFPETNETLGSPVAYIVPEFNDMPIIVAVISRPGETQLLSENVYKKTVVSKAGVVSLEMNPDGGLFINVDSIFEGRNNFLITLKSKYNDAKFDVKCAGDINLYSEGDISLELIKNVYLKKIDVNEGVKVDNASISLTDDGFKYEDKYGNKITCNTEGKIKFHDGKSPMVKGDELKDQLIKMKNTLDTFIETYLASVTTIDSDSGVSAKIAMELAMQAVRNEDFSKINSSKSFIK